MRARKPIRNGKCWVEVKGKLLQAKVRHVRKLGSLGVECVCVDAEKLGSMLFDSSDGFYLGSRKVDDVGMPWLMRWSEGCERIERAELTLRLANQVKTIGSVRPDIATIQQLRVMQQNLETTIACLDTSAFDDED
jgi:hypothetical protein